MTDTPPVPGLPERGESTGEDRRLPELVAAALALPGRERAAFIRAHAGGDCALADEAESLVRFSEQAGEFLDGRTLHALVQQGGADSSLLDEVGSVLGPYHLIGRLGRGGFGEVFLAERYTPVRRRVALKIVKHGMDTREVLARFEQERRVLELMEHPNIAAVLDAGASPSGRPYFVMELVEGEAITAFCDRRRLSIPARLAVLLKVCSAVQHAHQKGVIHRDIKPSNILVIDAGDDPTPKVIDFGIAKATTTRLLDSTLVTQAHQFIGTPEYVSPEQIDPAGDDVDTRSDIYSLGVLLHELLIGVTPLDRERFRAASVGQLQSAILAHDPAAPSGRAAGLGDRLADSAAARSLSPQRLVASLRGDLDWIVLRCLEKDRTRRYQTVDALALDLQRHVRGEPVTAVPPRLAYRAAKFLRRNRAGAVVSLVLLLALIVAMTGLGVGLVEARKGRRAAEAQADLAARTASFLKNMLAGAGPGVAMGRDTQLLRALLDDAAIRIRAGELAAFPDAELELRLVVGATLSDIGAYGPAIEMLTPALETARARWPGDHETTGRVLDTLGYALGRIGRVADALAVLQEALAMQRRLHPTDHPDLAKAIHDAGWGASGVHDYKEAEARYREGLGMYRRLHAGDHESTALSLHNVGGLIGELGSLDEAESMLRSALEMEERIRDASHPSVATAHYSLARVLHRKGQLVDAERHFRLALEIQRKLYSGDHLAITQSLYFLGRLLVDRGRTEPAVLAEARSMLVEGRDMSIRINLGTTSRSWDQVLAQAFYCEERFDDAAAITERLLAEAVAEHTGDHPVVAASHLRHGVALMGLGNSAKAETHLLAAIEMRRRIYRKEHVDIAIVLCVLAECRMHLGNAAEAMANSAEAAEIAARVRPETDSSRRRIEHVNQTIQAGKIPDRTPNLP